MTETDNSIIVSIDTLGSETSIASIIKGLNISFLRNDNYFFKLFGPQEILTHELQKFSGLKKKC